MRIKFNKPVILCILGFLFYFSSISFAQETDTTLARQYIEKASILAETRDYELSSNFYEKAIQIYENAELWEEVIRNRNKIGANLLYSNKLDETKTYFKDVLDSSVHLLGEEHKITAKIYNSLGTVFWYLNDYNNAIVFYEKALKITEKVLAKDGPEVAELYRNIASCHRNNNEFKNAVDYYLAAINIFKKIPAKELKIAACYNGIGLSYSDLGSFNISLEYYQKAMDIYIKLLPENDEDIAHVYHNMAIVFDITGATQKALTFFEKSLAIRESAANPNIEGLANTYNSLGGIYAATGAYQKALEYFEASLKMKKDHLVAKSIEVTSAYNNLGAVYFEMKDYSTALAHFLHALKLIEEISETHPRLVSTNSNIGETYNRLEKYDEALFYAQNALKLAEKLLPRNHVDFGLVYNNLGSIHDEMGKNGKAIKSYRDALSILNIALPGHHSDIVHANNNIAEAYYKNNDYKEALTYADKVITAEPERDITGKFELLRSYLIKTKVLRGLYKQDPSKLYLQQAYLVCVQFDKLIEQIRTTLTEYEDRITFNETAHELYELATEIAFLQVKKTGNQTYINAAFSFMEKSKANTLLASINAMEALQYAIIPDSVVLEERQLKKAIAASESKLIGLDTQKDVNQINSIKEKLFNEKKTYRAFILELEKTYPDYYQLKYQTTDLSIADVQATLNENDLLVEYLLGDTAIYILTIARDKAKIDRFLKPPVWDGTLQNLRRSIADHNFILNQDSTRQVFVQYSENAHRLYQYILEKSLGTTTRPNQNLRIIPDGQLNYIPFELLLKKMPATEIPDYKHLKYLINDHAISYAYSAALLLESGKKRQNNTTLSYGGFAPEYPNSYPTTLDSMEAKYNENLVYSIAMREGLDDLPAARASVAEIAQLFKGKAYLSNEATKQMFLEKAKQFNILHLGMHGLIDDVNPLYSKLVFTPDKFKSKDHLLNAGDIYNMELNADLTVLSACNTGFGKIKKGEGVMSLSRAFTYAGCPNIVMSLWSVPDAQTSEIMIKFFKQLKAGDPKDKALRNAKLSYLEACPQRVAHPLFWAGFVTTGNVKALSTDKPTSRWWLFGVIGLFAATFVIVFFYKL